MGKYRMEEPWGYREENDYESNTSTPVSVNGLFSKAEYSKSDNKMYFYDRNDTKCATIDVSEFEEESIIEKAYYDKTTQEVVIEFTNGDVVRINIKEVLDETEFKDGLQVNDGKVSVLIDAAGEGYEGNPYLSTSESGVKIAGIDKHISDAVEEERQRAVAEEERIDAKLDQEIADREADVDAEETRAKEAELAEETRAKAAELAEQTRAIAEEAAINRRIDTLNDELDAEKSIREAADVALGRRIDQEIADRKEDVDEEEARAKAAEEALDAKIDAEVERAKAAESAITDALTSEVERIDQEIADVNEKIDANATAIENEVARATSAETALQGEIESEGQRAQDAEIALDEKIDAEIERAGNAESALTEAFTAEISRVDGEIAALTADKLDNAVYDSSAKTINFYADGVVKATIDATDFIKDGMIEDVKIENGKLVIVFNTDSGKETIEIPLTDIFDPSNYYDKNAIDGIVSGINESIANEASVRLENDNALSQSIEGEKTRAEGAESALIGVVDAEILRATSAETDLHAEIELKADKETTYTKEEVDALLAEKETEITKANTEIYNLKKIVGDMGGNVTYDLPGEGKTFNTLMNNNGTVKLSEDVTTGRFGPGMMAKNKTTLNLNNNDLTISGLTTSSSQPGILVRGTQEITVGGKGTIDTGGGICIEAASANAIINLTGSTTTYHTNRPGGELIYCYAGTINISNGTFRNDGESNYTLNCYDANYQNGTAKIIVTGGKFYDFNPADNSAEGEHTNFLAEGYHVEVSTVTEEGVEHTVYTVKKDA